MGTNRRNLLEETIRGHIANALEQLRVAQPAVVESYDDAKGTAEVVPLLKRPFFGPGGTVTWKPLGKLPGVPVVQLAGGGRRIKFPAKAGAKTGDLVLLVFCDFGLGGWKAREGATDPQGVVTPKTLGAHQVGDAIAIAGLLNPLGAAPAVAIEVQDDGKVLIGAGASHKLIFGDDFTDATGAFHTLIAAIGSAVAAVPGASAAITTALNTYQSAVNSSKLSTVVKIA